MTSGEKALYHSIIEQLKDKELSDMAIHSRNNLDYKSSSFCTFLVTLVQMNF